MIERIAMKRLVHLDIGLTLHSLSLSTYQSVSLHINKEIDMYTYIKSSRFQGIYIHIVCFVFVGRDGSLFGSFSYRV